jgi:hypothetical protein
MFWKKVLRAGGNSYQGGETDVYEEHSDELIKDIMEEQKTDIDD